MRGIEKERIDGLSSTDIAKIRSALRRVWMWYSHSRQLVIKRCRISWGKYLCEKCTNIVNKIHVDHIVPVGKVDEGYIQRLYVSSKGLQGLCEECHKAKTKEERKSLSSKSVKNPMPEITYWE